MVSSTSCPDVDVAVRPRVGVRITRKGKTRVSRVLFDSRVHKRTAKSWTPMKLESLLPGEMKEEPVAESEQSKAISSTVPVLGVAVKVEPDAGTSMESVVKEEPVAATQGDTTAEVAKRVIKGAPLLSALLQETAPRSTVQAAVAEVTAVMPALQLQSSSDDSDVTVDIDTAHYSGATQTHLRWSKETSDDDPWKVRASDFSSDTGMVIIHVLNRL